MKRILITRVLFAIAMVKCNISETYYQTCSAYINKKSSSKFIESHVTSSVCTCALTCFFTNQCDAYTFNLADQTCSLYRNREVECINETTTDTQLYVERRPNGSQCPSNWYYYTQGDSCYFISDFPTDWHNAMAYCWEEMGAYLTNVNDQNEQDFLTHLINMTINTHVWIGLIKTGLDFMWVSNLNIGPQSLSYLNWVPNEPAQNRGAVKLSQAHTFMWNDSPVSSKAYFVCKKPAVTC